MYQKLPILCSASEQTIKRKQTKKGGLKFWTPITFFLVMVTDKLTSRVRLETFQLTNKRSHNNLQISNKVSFSVKAKHAEASKLLGGDVLHETCLT